MLQVRVYGEGQLGDIARALRRAPGDLRRELTTAVKEAARPTVRDIKQTVLTLPIHGFSTPARHKFHAPTRPKNLRARIARVVEADVSTSSAGPQVRFVVHNERLGRQRRLPYLLDSGSPWRHPIMGRRGRWAGEVGKPWFRVTVRKHEPQFKREVDKAIDRVERRIDR